MARKQYYYDIATGEPLDEEDALEASGIMKDGVALKVPMFMRGSNNNVLVDAFNEPISPNYGRKGYAFVDGDDTARRREDYEYQKAKLR